MKYLFYVIYLTLVVHHSQTQTIRNSNESKTYTIRDGIVRDKNVRMIGEIEVQGKVRNSIGLSLGTYSKGAFRDRNGRLIFRLEESGLIRDSNGRKVYTFSASGVIRDSSNRRIATFDGGPRWQIAAVFIYFIEP